MGLQGLRLVLVLREFNSTRLLKVDVGWGRLLGIFVWGLIGNLGMIAVH